MLYVNLKRDNQQWQQCIYYLPLVLLEKIYAKLLKNKERNRENILRATVTGNIPIKNLVKLFTDVFIFTLNIIMGAINGVINTRVAKLYAKIEQ